MAFGDTDLDVLMSDVFSVSITYGTQTALGILTKGASLTPDSAGTVMNVQETTVDIQTGDLTSLQQSTAITVNALSFIIADQQPMDDGKITRIWLSA